MAAKKRPYRIPVNYVAQALFVTHAQKEALAKLKAATRIATQVLLREGVDDLLKKYARELRSAKR